MPEQDVQTFNLRYDTWCADRMTGLTGVKPFEFFCADQFLKDRSLSDNEIKSGQVDASEDGGIDSLYCFFNGSLMDVTDVYRDFDARAGGIVELKLIQSKEHAGFSTTAIRKFGYFLDDLLSFSRPESEFKSTYHDKLMGLMHAFRRKFTAMYKHASPTLSIEFFFITRYDVEPKPNEQRAANKMTEQVQGLYSEMKIEGFHFVNVAKLWTQFNVTKPDKRFLKTVKQLDDKNGWVSLVNLQDYYKFLRRPPLLTEEKALLDTDMFESNVRGYQVNTKVNTRITSTLKVTGLDTKPFHYPEFWQLNNGITILTSDVTHADGQFKIDNPRIVNGLQTSQRIFEYYSGLLELPPRDERCIIVRVIKTSDETARSEIIRATNDQNPMPGEAFLATMRIQQQIQEYFAEHGLFYDRRKGQYKAERKPAAQIVEIVELMQAVIAIMQRMPDYARGRPREYLKDKKRQVLFGKDDEDQKDTSFPHPLNVYLRCVEIVRKVKDYLRGIADINDKTSLNLRYYLALDVTVRVIKNAHCPPMLVAEMDVERDLTPELLKVSYKRVRRFYLANGGNDDTARGNKMRKNLVASLKAEFSPSNKSKKKAPNSHEEKQIGIPYV
jgi:hypothetical protein